MAKDNVILSNLVSLEEVDAKYKKPLVDSVLNKGLLSKKQMDKMRRLNNDTEKLNAVLIKLAKISKTKTDTIDKLRECYEECGLEMQRTLLTTKIPHPAGTSIKVRKSENIQLDEEEYYKMASRPKGNVLLINVDKLRSGSDKDVIKLNNLWKGLGFKVEIKSKASSKVCMDAVKDFAKKKDHKKADSAVVFVMAHGLNNPDNNHEIDMEFEDGRIVNTEWIISQFSDENCPQLKGKPKMFFFQACRGHEHDFGSFRPNAVRTDGAPNHLMSNLPKTIGDIIVVCPCVPGKVALRDELSGAWMVQQLCDVFSEFACTEDLESMLRRVSTNLKTQRDRVEGMEVLTYENRSFDKKLYFNPGCYAVP